MRKILSAECPTRMVNAKGKKEKAEAEECWWKRLVWRLSAERAKKEKLRGVAILAAIPVANRRFGKYSVGRSRAWAAVRGIRWKCCKNLARILGQLVDILMRKKPGPR